MDKYVCLFDGQNDELFKNTEYNLVIFTGSTATGRHIYENCAHSLTKCVLELGGANPAVVDASAPPKHAATQLFLGKFTNGGQTCIAPNYCCFCGTQAKFDAFVQELKQQLCNFQKNYEHLVKIETKSKYSELCEML